MSIQLGGGGTAPTGTAGGDLSGTYPNPVLGTSGVSAATYGSATLIPSLVVDAKGRVTSASTSGVGLVVSDSVAASTAADTNLTTLATLTIPANTLSATGRLVEIVAWGTLGATANTKTVSIKFNGTIIATKATAGNGTAWYVRGFVMLTGVGAQKSIGSGLSSTTSESYTSAAPAGDATGAITVLIQGQNGTAAAADINYIASFIRAI